MPRCSAPVLAGLALVSVAGPACAADMCDTIKDAVRKMSDAPSYHSKTLMEGKGQQNVMEGIFLNDTAYIKPAPMVGWMSMPISKEDRQQQFAQGAFKRPLHDCRLEGKEAVDGVPAQIYSYMQDYAPNAEAPKGTQPARVQTKVWIGDKDGLPRRLDTDLLGKGHMRITVDYDDVKPPAVIMAPGR